jgi:hypothetical protein
VGGLERISNVDLVDSLLPWDKSWVALADGWGRWAPLSANVGGKRQLRLEESKPADAPTAAAPKLLVRDCDIDKLHKRLAAAADGAAGGAGGFCSSAGRHAANIDNWQVLVGDGNIPAGWRLATCWEGECSFECCCLIQVLVHACACWLRPVMHTQLTTGFAITSLRLVIHSVLGG